jgi:hypothetical protein
MPTTVARGRTVIGQSADHTSQSAHSVECAETELAVRSFAASFNREVTGRAEKEHQSAEPIVCVDYTFVVHESWSGVHCIHTTYRKFNQDEFPPAEGVT